MNNESEIRLNDEWFDRLVDGELSPAEYRELLRAVERDPEGWRLCALAFLEAQAWGRELRTAQVSAPAARSIAPPARTHWSWWYGSLLAVACAASFLLALGVSLQIQGRLWTGPDPNDFARYTPPSPPSIEGPVLPGDVPESKAANDLHLVGKPDVPSGLEQEGAWPMGRYRLVVDNGSGQPQEVEMPIFASADPRSQWLLDEEATAPHEIIQALRNRGNEVERRRNWIPMQSQSGVPIYVPVDELHVTPVSNRSFQ